jgi:hypothetical protein
MVLMTTFRFVRGVGPDVQKAGGKETRITLAYHAFSGRKGVLQEMAAGLPSRGGQALSQSPCRQVGEVASKAVPTGSYL